MKYIVQKQIPNIEQFILITEDMLKPKPMWPNEPFVYQFHMFSNLPKPLGIEEMHYQIDYMDVVKLNNGEVIPLWDSDLIYYSDSKNPIFHERLKEFNSNWPELTALFGF